MYLSFHQNGFHLLKYISSSTCGSYSTNKCIAHVAQFNECDCNSRCENEEFKFNHVYIFADTV